MKLHDAVDRLMVAQRQHTLHDRPAGDGNGSHLSAFECSCGQEFIPSELVRAPSTVPSMAAVHRAVEQATAVDSSLRNLETVRDRDGLAALPAWTVVRTSRGTMAQRIDSTGQWLTQGGRRVDSSLMSLPATVLWRSR